MVTIRLYAAQGDMLDVLDIITPLDACGYFIQGVLTSYGHLPSIYIGNCPVSYQSEKHARLYPVGHQLTAHWHIACGLARTASASGKCDVTWFQATMLANKDSCQYLGLREPC